MFYTSEAVNHEYDQFVGRLSRGLSLQLILTSAVSDLSGKKRQDPEHLTGARDYAVLIPNGGMKAGIKGYRLTGKTPRFSCDIWFLVEVFKVYGVICRENAYFKNFSILIEHDHFHIARDEIGGVFSQIGTHDDPVPFIAGFNVNTLVEMLNHITFKKVVKMKLDL